MSAVVWDQPLLVAIRSSPPPLEPWFHHVFFAVGSVSHGQGEDEDDEDDRVDEDKSNRRLQPQQYIDIVREVRWLHVL